MTSSSYKVAHRSFRVTPVSRDVNQSGFSLTSGNEGAYLKKSAHVSNISKLRVLWSIQSVVAFVFMLVVIITAISVWLPTFIAARESLKDHIVMSSNQLDSMVKEFTFNLIQDSIKLSTAIWTQIYLDNSLLDMSNELRLRQLMFSAMNAIPSLGSTFLGRNDGQITSLIRSGDTMTTQRCISNGTMYYYTIDPKTCETIGLIRSAFYGDVLKTNWYQAAEKERGMAWAPVSAGKATNRTILNLGRAVYSSSDTDSYNYEQGPTNKIMLAVFGTGYFLDGISEYLKKLNVGKQGRVVIIDRSGLMVATSVGSPTSYTSTGIAPTNVLEHSDRIVRETMTYVWKSHESSFVNVKESNFRLTTSKQESLIVQISTFTDPYGLDWLIASVLSYDEKYGKIRNGTIISGVLSASALVLAIVVAIALGTMITVPIRQVTRQLYRVANMELDSPKEVGNTGRRLYEISNMQLALTRMKDGLQNFAKYVPSDLVRQLLVSGEKAEPGVKSAVLTVSFTDIIGFTSIAENTSPKILVTVMQEFFMFANQLIAQQEGTIDKYIGDCVMSFWGGPVPINDPEVKAVTAAFDLMKLLDARNPEWKDQGYPTITVRTGINTAKCLVGNIGAPSRLNYTALGDGVNLAARLESLNNLYKTKIMIGQSTYQKVKDVFACRWLDFVTVKGKGVPTHVYEVIGVREHMSTQEIADQVGRFKNLRDLLIEKQVDEVIRLCQDMMDNMTDKEIESHHSLNILYTRLVRNKECLHNKVDEK